MMMDRRRIDLLLSRRRRFKNIVMLGIVGFLTVIAVSPLMMVFYYILKMGLPALNLDFFTQLPAPTGQVGGGMGNAILGSLIMIGMATIISIPIGVFGGVYLSEYGQGKLAASFRLCVDLLTSLPSIVVGLYVYAVLVVPMKGFSAYAGAAALLILMTPIVVKTTEEVLKLLPIHVREAGLALGIPRWRVILSIVLKGRMPAVITGIMLAIARVAGETAPLLVTAFGNRNWPNDLSQPTPSLPVQIYNYAISPYEDWHRQAWAGALTLVVMIFILNIFSRLVMGAKKSGRY